MIQNPRIEYWCILLVIFGYFLSFFLTGMDCASRRLFAIVYASPNDKPDSLRLPPQKVHPHSLSVYAYCLCFTG